MYNISSTKEDIEFLFTPINKIVQNIHFAITESYIKDTLTSSCIKEVYKYFNQRISYPINPDGTIQHNCCRYGGNVKAQFSDDSVSIYNFENIGLDKINHFQINGIMKN